MMIFRFVRTMLAWVVLILAGCGGLSSPYKGTWVATPEFVEVDHALCRARITPQKGDNPYYAVFLLTVVNKSGNDLAVDWNASRYLFAGTPRGVLVFEGINPEAVKNGTVPMEIIAPGGRLERRLMPMQLIAWSPIKDNTVKTRGITPGMLPAGENGILLSFRQASANVRLPLTVLLSLEKRP